MLAWVTSPSTSVKFYNCSTKCCMLPMIHLNNIPKNVLWPCKFLLVSISQSKKYYTEFPSLKLSVNSLTLWLELIILPVYLQLLQFVSWSFYFQQQPKDESPLPLKVNIKETFQHKWTKKKNFLIFLWNHFAFNVDVSVNIEFYIYSNQVKFKQTNTEETPTCLTI